jgi:hypothetical protein
MADWYSQLQQQLPGATAVLCYGTSSNDFNASYHGCEGTNAGYYTLKIWWQTPEGTINNAYTLTFSS